MKAEKMELRFEAGWGIGSRVPFDEAEGSSLFLFCMEDIITWQKNQSQVEAQNP
jgi:hypothetical protein